MNLEIETLLAPIAGRSYEQSARGTAGQSH